MQKFLSLILLLAVSTGTLRAQTPETPTSVLERYYKLSGMDKVDLKKATAAIDMNITVNGMSFSASNIMQLPDKMKVDVVMMGQKISLVFNGNRAVATIPGFGSQELPKEQIKELRRQNDMLSAMKWRLEDYTFTSLSQQMLDGKLCDVVTMTPKASDMPYTSQTLRFDHATGLLESSLTEINSPQGPLTVESTYGSYVHSGEILYPSQIDATTSGITTSVHIYKMVINCPIAKGLFSLE